MSTMYWWNNYRGIPYAHGQASFMGCWCWGLVVLIYREERGIELPPFSGVTGEADSIAYKEAMGIRPPGWIEVQAHDVREFDVVTFVVAGLFHAGVILDPRPGRFLHVCRDGNVVTESYKSFAWKHRCEGFWRYGGVA